MNHRPEQVINAMLKNMNLSLNRQKQSGYLANTLFARVLATSLLLMMFCNCVEAATLNQCKRAWRLNNGATNGMKFGTFTIEAPGPGTVTLTGGGGRTSSGTIDLVSGSAVNSHQIIIANNESFDCGLYGITIEWRNNPDTRNMTGPGTAIPVSNPQVVIEGEGLVTLPYTFSPPIVPLDLEVTATMTPTSGQAGGTYTSNVYRLRIVQDGRGRNRRGTSETVAITPLTLTAGVAMNFGQLASGSSGGTIVLNASSGARSVGSGDAEVITVASPGTPGTFTIQGEASQTFSVSYGNGSLTNAGGGNAMALTGFTDTSAAIVLTGGADPFSVGATLNMSGSQPAGNYSTSNPGGVPYTVTVNYN